MNQILNNVRKGEEVEKRAKVYLENTFDKVIWKSNKIRTHPYDFLCIKDNKEYFIDVKDSRKVIAISISDTKMKKIESGNWNPFYYLQFLPNEEFLLISYDEAKSKGYFWIQSKVPQIKPYVLAKCHKCETIWKYTGKHLRATCPHCGKINKVQTQ